MIIGVAIRNDVVTIRLPKPNRHADCFEYANKIGINCIKAKIGIKGKDQGFYTHTGKYLDRAQAARYVKRVKQKIIISDSNMKMLFSEDLY